ncbi:hypothetical protein H8S76_25485 [Blautia sp. NSJ-34]|uniref:DUF1523 family protein n=1 Tax=Blautia celeris TaxID=2763026 RepID=A0ABR7FL55_9FIRM|nr:MULTISPECIES: hypothetical protein [Blautia]MBC5675588.1 hypothetical protein [Blautia celeris]
MYRKRMARSLFTCVLSIVGIIIIFSIAFYRPINKVSNKREATAVVTDKVVKNSSDQGRYLIFTEDEDGNINTYEITDSLLAGRFDSSDLYASIKVGGKYRFEIGGSRNQVLSWYPNIYSCELIETTHLGQQEGKE